MTLQRLIEEYDQIFYGHFVSYAAAVLMIKILYKEMKSWGWNLKQLLILHKTKILTDEESKVVHSFLRASSRARSEIGVIRCHAEYQIDIFSDEDSRKNKVVCAIYSTLSSILNLNGVDRQIVDEFGSSNLFIEEDESDLFTFLKVLSSAEAHGKRIYENSWRD